MDNLSHQKISSDTSIVQAFKFVRLLLDKSHDFKENSRLNKGNGSHLERSILARNYNDQVKHNST